MSTLYQCDLCRAQGWTCEYPDMLAAKMISSINQDPTQRGVTTEGHASTELVVDKCFHAPSPMSTSYECGPLPAPDAAYGTGDRAVVVLHIPSVMHWVPEAQLTSSPTTEQSAQAPCPAASCRWRDEGTPRICNILISCEGVPTHFKHIHGIKNTHESVLVPCRWEGCHTEGARKNFARHIRECHLNHIRDKGHSS